jgi:carbonic anhydrase
MRHSEALDRLKQGNKRFASGLRSVEAMATEGRRVELATTGQKPFAMVLSCADSRVPSEMVFDCGLGELFVVRVAGNIVAPSLIGSIEFAAESFGTQLCVVMGHSQCGAVSASVGAAVSGSRPESDNVQNIVLEILPSVKAAMRAHPGASKDCLVHAATEINVRQSVDNLVQRSHVIARLVEEGRLRVVGATYDLHTGKVLFLDQDEAQVEMPLSLYEDQAPSAAPRQAANGKTPGRERFL